MLTDVVTIGKIVRTRIKALMTSSAHFANFNLTNNTIMHTVRGIYQDGKVILEELLPISQAKVLVTVLKEQEKQVKPRKPGAMKGEIWMSDDFNDSLELEE